MSSLENVLTFRWGSNRSVTRRIRKGLIFWRLIRGNFRLMRLRRRKRGIGRLRRIFRSLRRRVCILTNFRTGDQIMCRGRNICIGQLGRLSWDFWGRVVMRKGFRNMIRTKSIYTVPTSQHWTHAAPQSISAQGKISMEWLQIEESSKTTPAVALSSTIESVSKLRIQTRHLQLMHIFRVQLAITTTI